MGVSDDLGAYLLDGAVVTFGTIVENALAERDTVGQGAKQTTRPRYELSQLLRRDFRLPHPMKERMGGADGQRAAIAHLRGLKGVKVFRGKPA